jgi:hypothetical protein
MKESGTASLAGLTESVGRELVFRVSTTWKLAVAKVAAVQALAEVGSRRLKGGIRI